MLTYKQRDWRIRSDRSWRSALTFALVVLAMGALFAGLLFFKFGPLF